MELQTSSSRHQAEVLELKQEVRRLSSLVERGNQALQHKAQVWTPDVSASVVGMRFSLTSLNGFLNFFYPRRTRKL